MRICRNVLSVLPTSPPEIGTRIVLLLALGGIFFLERLMSLVFCVLLLIFVFLIFFKYIYILELRKKEQKSPSPCLYGENLLCMYFVKQKMVLAIRM